MTTQSISSMVADFQAKIASAQETVATQIKNVDSGELSVTDMSQVQYVTTIFSVIADMSAGILKGISDTCKSSVQKL